MARVVRNEVGSMTVELVVLTPVLVVFALIALGFGRYELARQRVEGAADVAAAAAAVAATPGSASPAAVSAADVAIAPSGDTCKRSTVATDTSDFQAGGVVRVTVTCDVTFADLTVPGMPGTVVVRRTSVAPIDPYRVVG
jgi:Flp pilus assembly protein TadG